MSGSGRRAWRAVWVAALIVLVTVRPAAAGEPTSPWYDDVPSSDWAYDAIHDLWSVGVTDGWSVHPYGSRPWVRVERFEPDAEVERVHYAVMLAKAFELTPQGGALPYVDVPSSFLIYGKFDAVPWLVAAYRTGILPDGRTPFAPSAEIERQDAVAWLIRALGLEGYARSLSSSDVDALLSGFRDGWQVQPALRQEIGAAIRLRILRGYPDRTLRPRSSLTRSEAATVIYRSAWVRLEADPNPFSPDHDGIADVVSIHAHSLQNGNLAQWRVWVEDSQGETLRTLSVVPAGASRVVAIWDGRDDAARPLAPGVYYARAEIRSYVAEPRTSTPLPIRLEMKRLDASLHPSRVPPDTDVTILASTSAPAARIDAVTPWGHVALHRSSDVGGWENWWASFRVPKGVALGTYAVRVEAVFTDGGRRSANLTLEVVPPPGSTPEDYGRQRLPSVRIALTGADPFAP
ncbi:MAG: S-layer homology domain-containing protein [Clostridia bacterium]|nr:S-layer homology domain-containing protein [Clostridia bacterium]